MNQRDSGRKRGRRAAAGIDAERYATDMAAAFALTRLFYPDIVDVDLAATIRDYDRERLACEPDYARFPEMRGLLDRHQGEREGFRETTGLDESGVAFHFSWGFFVSRRMNARHVARYDLCASPACPLHQRVLSRGPGGRHGG